MPMVADVREVVVSFYSQTFMRALDTNAIVERIVSDFPKVERIIFEKMSDGERAIASSIDQDEIVHVHSRCFVYVQVGGERRRVEPIEAEIERTNV